MSTNIPDKNIDSKTLRKFEDSATFTQTLPVTATEFDIVLQFFQKQSGNHEAARSLAGDFLKQAKINNFDAVDIIKDLEGLTGMQLNSTIAALFNAGREKTSLLGFRSNRIILNNINRTVIA